MAKSWATITFFGSWLSLMLFLILFWVFWKTPALEYITSIITGKSLVLLVNRSNQVRIKTAKLNAEGILDVKNVGPILIAENSHIIDKISGRPMYISFGEFAATIPMWWIYVVNFLKRKGIKVGRPLHNSSDYGAEIGLKFDESTGAWKKTNKEMTDADIKVKPWLTVKIADLANMFPYNITPALMESKIEYALARQMKFWKTDTGRLMVYAMVLIIVVIAGYLALKLYPGLTEGGDIRITVDQLGNIIKTNSSMVG